MTPARAGRSTNASRFRIFQIQLAGGESSVSLIVVDHSTSLSPEHIPSPLFLSPPPHFSEMAKTATGELSRADVLDVVLTVICRDQDQGGDQDRQCKDAHEEGRQVPFSATESAYMRPRARIYRPSCLYANRRCLQILLRVPRSPSARRPLTKCSARST